MNMVTINIEKIMENGDRYERAFISWLNNHQIFWSTLIPLTNIMISEKDYLTIKEYWPEIELK